MKKQQLKYSLILLVMSMIWGFAFAFQSLGADNLKPLTFFTFRNYIAVITMGIMLIFRKDEDKTDNKFSFKLGLFCGVVEGLACVAQQYSITYTTAANCSFITSLYVVLVPILNLLIFRNKTDNKIWFCVILEIVGLYLISIKGGTTINKGDIYALIGAVMYAGQIIIISRGGQKMDAIILTFAQLLVCALMGTVLMIIFETPINFEGVRKAIIPLLYTGVLSSAIAVTLQAVCQKKLDPTVASLIMCLESVFGAVGGFLVLHEVLSTREIIGCIIMFVAIVLSQIPSRKK